MSGAERDDVLARMMELLLQLAQGRPVLGGAPAAADSAA
jgi:hypothetical protein